MDTDISSFLLSVSVCLSVHLSTHPLAQPGLPPLLSLLLCVIPSKAIHLTYEPTWQLPSGEPPTTPNSDTSLSFSRQVMAPLGATPLLPSGLHSLCMQPRAGHHCPFQWATGKPVKCSLLCACKVHPGHRGRPAGSCGDPQVLTGLLLMFLPKGVSSSIQAKALDPSL